MERLQKIIAQAGLASRRGAEKLIRQGRVTVDGKIVTEMGVKVNPKLSHICCNGKKIQAEKKIYLLLNKPAGYVTTLNDPQGRPIVTDLLTELTEAKRVYPVGRLDIDTRGALILTNDGELTQRILHPSHEVGKTYIAIVRKHPDRRKLRLLAQGIKLDGKVTAPATVEVLSLQTENTKIKIRIHEGKKRQIRKMFAAIDHPVFSLKRIAYGNLKLGNLRPGKYRYLNKEDIKKIFS